MASMAAVEKDPHRFEGLAGGVEMAFIQKASAGVVFIIVPKAPAFVLGGRGSWCWSFSPSG